MLGLHLCGVSAGWQEPVNTLTMKAEELKDQTEKLAVLWVSGDRDVAEKSCLMYTHAAKRNGWFDEVVLEACIACSDQLGVTEELLELGIDVKGMGVPLTSYLKEGYHVLTY